MNLLTDNPELYEHQFPDPEHRAAHFVADLVHRHGGGRRLLDVGSGTGRDAGHLATLGFDVTGIDLSDRMLAYATATYPNARFQAADMRTFAVDGPFDVITCLDSALLYCHSTEDLLAFLTRCHEHLRPGGLLIAEMRNGAFFLGNTELLDGTRTRSVTWRGVDYRSHTTLTIDHAAQLLRRKRIWDLPSGPLEQHSAWRLLFPQELRHLLATTAFTTEALFDQPGPRTEPPWHTDAELGTALSGDRLHLVARKTSQELECQAATDVT